MKHPLLCFVLSRFVMALALLAGAQSPVFARAGGSLTVSYGNADLIIEGNMPLVKTVPITLTISGGSGTAVPIGFNVVPSTPPVGTIADAAKCVSLSPSTVMVTPGSTVTLNFLLTVDLSSMPLPSTVTSATFSYQVYTSGWQNGTGQVNVGMSVSDAGFSINATESAPPPSGSPPSVRIDTPVNGAVLTYAVGAVPSTIPFQFTASSTGTPITITEATLGGNTVTVNPGPPDAAGTVIVTGNLPIAGAGNYTFVARAQNANGTASATSNFTVSVVSGPTITITNPTNNASFPYRLNGTAASIPVTISAVSPASTIQTLSAKVDGTAAALTPSGIGNATATGTFPLSYDKVTNPSGIDTHTIEATTTDAYGTATTQTTFTVYLVKPVPSVTIASPDSTPIMCPANTTTIDVPFAFTATSTNNFTVDTVSAVLDGITPVTIANAPGLGTSATVNGTGTIPAVTIGTHTLTVNTSSATIPATTTVTFVVKATATQPPQPSVTIDAPAANATFTRYLNGPALSIPLTFTGVSNATDGVITAMTATLDGSPLAVSGNLGTKSVTGTASMVATTSGHHTIVVTATDKYGQATQSQTFSVTILDGYNVAGTVFFDFNSDGVFSGSEFGLGGVAVSLKSTAGQSFGSTTTAADGTYTFTKIPPGSYVVTATAPYAGLTATKGTSANATVTSANVGDVNIGFMLDFCAIQTMSANGYSLGFWKTNVTKALKGSCGGTQVTAANLGLYTTAIGSFGLPIYDNLTMPVALTIMSSKSSQPTALLSKQLLAAEYNYQNGAYLNGNAGLTSLFIWWGEYVLSNPTQFSSAYTLWAKDWFDAYDNSHGGTVGGPAPTGGSCTGTGSGSSGSGSCDSGEASNDDHHHDSGSTSDDDSSDDDHHSGSCGGGSDDSRDSRDHGDDHHDSGGSDHHDRGD